MEQELSKYLEQQLRAAMEGEMPPSWQSPEAERMAEALRAVFSDALTDRARERIFLRLGLASLSGLVHRGRAAMVAARAAALMRDAQAPRSGGTP